MAKIWKQYLTTQNCRTSALAQRNQRVRGSVEFQRGRNEEFGDIPGQHQHYKIVKLKSLRYIAQWWHTSMHPKCRQCTRNVHLDVINITHVSTTGGNVEKKIITRFLKQIFSFYMQKRFPRTMFFFFFFPALLFIVNVEFPAKSYLVHRTDIALCALHTHTHTIIHTQSHTLIHSHSRKLKYKCCSRYMTERFSQ